MKMMLNQARGGHIFNIDGAGSDGRPTPRFAAYGATKRSVVHLTKSLQVYYFFTLVTFVWIKCCMDICYHSDIIHFL